MRGFFLALLGRLVLDIYHGIWYAMVMKKQKYHITNPLNVHAKLALDDVLSCVAECKVVGEKRTTKAVKCMVGEQAFIVNVFSLRLQTFVKSVECAFCGVKGEFFLLVQGEKDPKAHFNLYANDPLFGHIVMTHDHIVARSIGGHDNITNTQAACIICNNIKGKLNMPADEVKIRREAYNAQHIECKQRVLTADHVGVIMGEYCG